jgi:hypothetical protein
VVLDAEEINEAAKFKHHQSETFVAKPKKLKIFLPVCSTNARTFSASSGVSMETSCMPTSQQA